ncbi:PREDICTED: bromodomain and WD repeat-containing DDB_G0285837-like, partial [Rhagoletis zephyria]|uniref:bromodomain and WD repeat-containing DDB_G0285837-like n=1 Tax=Rhagoletis zephyria TaxID=28612 RepID=UPI00081143A5
MDVNEGSGHTADDGTEERLTMPSQETSSSQPSTSSKLCCLHNEDETLLQSKIMKFIKDNFVKKVSTSAINIMKNITGFDKNRTYTGVDLEHMFGTLILVLEAECSKFLNNEFLTSNQTASHSTDAPQLLFLNSSQLTQPETTPPETQTTSNNSKTHVHSDELDAYDNNDDDDDDHQLESNLLSDEQLSSSSSGVHSPSSDQDDQPAAADNLHASSTSSHPTELQTSSSGDQTTVIIHLPSSTSIPEVAATESSETPTTETAEPLPEGGQPSIGLEPNDQVKDEAIDLAQILFGDDDESDFHDAVSSLSGLSVDEQCGDKPSDTAQVDSQLQGEDGHDENVNISANDDDDEEPERRCKKLNTDQRSNQRKDGDLNKRPKPLNDGRISIPDIEKELRLQSNLREQSNFEDISSDDSKLDLVFETSPSTSQRSENENSPNDNVSKETDELVSNSNTTAETDHPNEHIIEAAQEDQSEQSLSKDSDPLNNNDDNEEEEEDLLEPYVNENQPDIFGEADEDRQIVENIAQFGFESMHSDNENIEDLFEPWVNENLPDLFREANDDEGADDDDDDDDDDEGADDDNADEEMENTAGDEGDAENDASLADDSDHHEHDDDEEEAAAATAAEQSDNEANVSDAESENALVLDSNSDNEAPNSMYTQIRSIIQSANRLLNGSPKTAAVGTNKTTEKKPTTAQTEANNVLKVNNSTDDDENEDDETSSKNAMLNNENDEDDDDDDEDYDARGSSFASRKRLKRIISPGRLLKETRDAGRSERERRRRIEEKQKLYNRLANKSIKEKEEKKEEVDEKAEVDDGVQQVKQLVLDIDPTTQE